MAKSIHRVTTVVRNITKISEDVKLLELTDLDGWILPPFTAGSHLDVHLPSGLIRQYSLCGDPADRTCYNIAVKKELKGRGGSDEVHNLEIGEELLLSLPRNMLPLVNAPCVIFIAGGIGITPFMPMIYELIRADRPFALHFATRSDETTPFREDLINLCHDQVAFYHKDKNNRLNILDVISGLKKTDHLYCCGPMRMIEEVLDKTENLTERTHVEYFCTSVGPIQAAYEIHLARSKKTIPVVKGQTMLEALRAAEINIPASCEGGICMDCKTRYLEGNPIHRDITMPLSERSQFLTPCVSGCSGEKITLDI